VLTRLDHIAIAVRDLELAERDYARILGRTPAWQAAHPAAGVRNVRFGLGNTAIELVAADSDGEAATPLRRHLDADGEGIYSLALGTDDIDHAAALMREQGLLIDEPASGISQDGPSGAFRRFRSVWLPPSETGGARVSVHEEPTRDEIPPSLSLTDESSCVQALDHVVVMTQDAERARALYGERLGIRLALDKTFEDRGARILFFRLGGATIEVGASSAGHSDAPDRESEPDRLWGLAFQVSDIDAARERIQGAGIDVSNVRDGFKPDTRVCTVKSHSHGVATLLIQPSKR
jgi:catechol 2,3-dioxygenase-like lactoylglutathione lyase family enzyme